MRSEVVHISFGLIASSVMMSFQPTLLVLFVFLVGARSQASDKTCKSDCESKIFYNALLTPPAILDNAHFGEPYSLTSRGDILFGRSRVALTRLLRLQLATASKLDKFQTVLVDVTYSHRNPVSPTADMDLTVLLSDGISAVGFKTVDKSNFGDHPPLYPCEGLSGHKLQRMSCKPGKERFTSDPSTVHILHFRLEPQRPATAAGYSHVMSVYNQYTKKLQPERGLYLEFYRDDNVDQYIISFIKVQAQLEHLR